MSQSSTHYDSLKVARDAPPEVIRAAYRVLAQRYHPDRNPGDTASASTMSMINEAYRVLSNPDLRQQYDLLLRSLELAASLRNASAEAGSPRTKDQRNHPLPPENPHTEQVPGSRTVDLDEIWAHFVGQGGQSVHSVRESPNSIRDKLPVSGTVDLEKVWESFVGFFKPWGSRK